MKTPLPVPASLSRATEASVHTGEGLQLERDVLHYMSHPGSLLHALIKATRMPFRTTMFIQAGHKLLQPIEEAGDLIGRAFLQLFQVQDHNDQLVAANGPVVRPYHSADFQNLHRRLGDWSDRSEEH